MYAAIRGAYPSDRLVDAVITFRRQFKQFAGPVGRDQNAMLDGICFTHGPEFGAGGEFAAGFEFIARDKAPGLLPIQRRDVHAPRDMIPCLAKDLFQRPLYAVEDSP